MSVTVNMDKAKDIAHGRRRMARNFEFEPWDRKATVPSLFEEAEQKRQEIRDKYVVVQNQIDAATTIHELTQINKELPMRVFDKEKS